MTTEKMEMIEAYLNAKKGDQDKDVDETLVHRWKPFTDEDIREVACMLTKNDIRRYLYGKYRFIDDMDKDFIDEFDLELKDDRGNHQGGKFNNRIEEREYKDGERNVELYCKMNSFLNKHNLDKKTWNKFLKWYNTFDFEYGYKFTYKKDIEGKMVWEVLCNLDKAPLPPHMIEKNKGDLLEYWRLQGHERMNEWFEANVEGYKEFED